MTAWGKGQTMGLPISITDSNETEFWGSLIDE